ncbi:unnamed protein product [Larinioides sclopetarius]
MNKPDNHKPSFGLERLFLAWYSANLFVRRALANVESLHDYTMAPYPGEIPYRDVEDKMSGNIRMLCFWINVNFFYRSGNHFFHLVKSVINYIQYRGKEPSSVKTPGPNSTLVLENEGQVMSSEDSEVNLPTERKMPVESDSSEQAPKEDYTNSNVQDDQNRVAPSGCIAW